MVRAITYLVVSAVIWLGEGFLFSRLLGFTVLETALAAVVYLCLYAVSVAVFVRHTGRIRTANPDLPEWRLLSAAPMIVVIVGSFISLPLLVAIYAIGSRF